MSTRAALPSALMCERMYQTASTAGVGVGRAGTAAQGGGRQGEAQAGGERQRAIARTPAFARMVVANPVHPGSFRPSVSCCPCPIRPACPRRRSAEVRGCCPRFYSPAGGARRPVRVRRVSLRVARAAGVVRAARPARGRHAAPRWCRRCVGRAEAGEGHLRAGAGHDRAHASCPVPVVR